MAAPEYVPVKPMDDVRAYESPPRRPASWRADRPGDLVGDQPREDRFGSPGPDQGYAIKLARDVFGPRLRLDGVERDDAIAGCLAIALKRASIFGRAPIAHDLGLAFGLWGFLEEAPPAELADLRRRVFSGVAHPHHYFDARAIADAVPESTLRLPHRRVGCENWRELIDVAALEAGHAAPEGSHG